MTKYAYQITALINLALLLFFSAATSHGVTYTMSAFTNNSDSSIIRHSDGKYWMTYTTDWSANSIGFAVSNDRENGTFSHNYTTPIANLTESWAPEWFVDTDGSPLILVSQRTSADGEEPKTSAGSLTLVEFMCLLSFLYIRGYTYNHRSTPYFSRHKIL